MSYYDAMARLARDIDTAMFSGWSRGHWETFSRCHSAEVYVQRPDYYAGVPSCRKCEKALGPDDLRREWVPPTKNDPTTTMPCPWPLEPRESEVQP